MDDVEKRVERAEALISMGEISAARQAMEGSPLAPGNQDTLARTDDLQFLVIRSRRTC